VSSDLESLAKQAYIYGYPLVYDVSQVVSQTTKPTVLGGAPVNLFAHADQLAGPNDRFVSINNDTLYSIANCDVTHEPLVLHAPDTHDRYYVLQFVDAWTNNFAYIGRRATGTQEQFFLLASSYWDGETPAGMQLIRAPTNVFTIVGRFSVAGSQDLPAVRALQAETSLTPLSTFSRQAEQPARQMGDWNVAPFDTRVPQEQQFWEKLRAWLALFPPPQGDRPFVEMLHPLGLLEPESPYVVTDPLLAQVLETGAREGQEEIEAITRAGHGSPVNGWQSGLHSFDYNLDYFGPGTIDSPAWKVASRRHAYLRRAAAARGGLWGNHGYEAVYESTYTDDHGEQLNGARQYVLHLVKEPPQDAFWSLTMYDVPDFSLVANAIERYSIGDRTPGLKKNVDGSIDIFIQHDAPDPDQQSNWLPAPAGDFRPVMRMYQPRTELINGDYSLPPIRRAA
jgi:hypothetical protein